MCYKSSKVLLGGTAEITGRLLKMAPGVLRELFLKQFLVQSPRSFFGEAKRSSLEGKKSKGCLSELGPEVSDLRRFLTKNRDALRTGNMDEQSNYDSGATENCSRELSRNCCKRSIPRSLPVFLTIPPSKIAGFRQKEKKKQF